MYTSGLQLIITLRPATLSILSPIRKKKRLVDSARLAHFNVSKHMPTGMTKQGILRVLRNSLIKMNNFMVTYTVTGC